MGLLIVDKLDIIDCLDKNGHVNMQIPDEKYVLPTHQSIQDFGARYGNFLFNSGLDKWLGDIWDCDDFSFTAKALADIDNAVWKYKTGNKDSSLAFGMCFIQTKEGGHAISMAILQEEDGKLGVHYYEPQFQTTEEGINVCMLEKSRDSFLSPVFCYL